jgi:aspartyl-tRNA(Asn)/glutamyl-tRNA(Gln) amidotransferase subunit B
MAELMRELSGRETHLSEFPLSPRQLAGLVKLIDNQTISGKMAKNVFADILKTDKDPEAYVKEKGLVQITDSSAIEKMIEEVIAANPKAVEEYKGGKEGAINSLVGQAMKASKGKANPQMVRDLLLKKLTE